MLGLPDRFHAFVVFQRFRQRCRSRVTDGVVAETARIAVNAQRKVQGIVLDQKRRCAHGKGRIKNSDGRKGGERWFECLAYRIVSTLLLYFSASAIAVAPGLPMLLFMRLHGLRRRNKKVKDSVRPKKEDATHVVLRAAVARDGLHYLFHRIVSQPTDSIVQGPCCSCPACCCCVHRVGAKGCHCKTLRGDLLMF